MAGLLNHSAFIHDWDMKWQRLRKSKFWISVPNIFKTFFSLFSSKVLHICDSGSLFSVFLFWDSLILIFDPKCPNKAKYSKSGNLWKMGKVKFIRFLPYLKRYKSSKRNFWKVGVHGMFDPTLKVTKIIHRPMYGKAEKWYSPCSGTCWKFWFSNLALIWIFLILLIRFVLCSSVVLTTFTKFTNTDPSSSSVSVASWILQ